MAKRKPSAAFMKPVQPNEKLALVVGSKPLPRTELTKKLWQYIKITHLLAHPPAGAHAKPLGKARSYQ